MRWSHLVSLDMRNYPPSSINIHGIIKNDSREADESALNFPKMEMKSLVSTETLEAPVI